MQSSEREQIQAADRICRKLNITIQQLFEKIDHYNKRVEEINRETTTYVKAFIAPKAVMVNGQLEYELNDDDKAILSGYKKRGQEQLAKEFPEFDDIWDDLKHFQGDVDLNMYL
jgi:hypothetical protein